MKIALCGTEPASMGKAPFGDQSWQIWGCSPGLYPYASRVNAWFEMHRWEPPVIGRPDQQVPWFSPEYVMWMARLAVPVWMIKRVPELPTSQPLPWRDLVKKYGHFFFNSTLSWMAAMAIESILLNRELLKNKDERAFPASAEGDMIGFWGVDMAADEEQYTGQKAGCQFFATLAASMGIHIVTPPESDLMIPRPLYGICEDTHRHIKLLARQKQLHARRAMATQAFEQSKRDMAFIDGVLDDMKYHMNTWIHEGDIAGTNFEEIFAKPIALAANDTAAAAGDLPEPLRSLLDTSSTQPST